MMVLKLSSALSLRCPCAGRCSGTPSAGDAGPGTRQERSITSPHHLVSHATQLMALSSDTEHPQR